MTPPPIRLPEVNTRVSLFAEGWEARLETRVEGVSFGMLVLAQPSDGEKEVGLPRGAVLDVEWVTPRGLAKVAARVGGRGMLRVPTVVVEIIGEPELFQRRDYVRAPVVLDIVATPLLDGAEPVWGTALDLSGGGLQARLSGLEIQVGGRVDLGIGLPDEETVYATCRVLRRVDHDTLVLIFEDIERRDRERLIRFVFARLRSLAWMAA